MKKDSYKDQKEFAEHIIQELRESADDLQKAIDNNDTDNLPVSAVKMLSLKRNVAFSIGGDPRDLAIVTPRLCEHLVQISPINALLLFAAAGHAFKEKYPSKESFIDDLKNNASSASPEVMQALQEVGGSLFGDLSKEFADITDEDLNSSAGEKAKAAVAQALKNLGK